MTTKKDKTIVLIDRNESVRGLTHTFLVNAGYTNVHDFGSISDSIESVWGYDPALVICDAGDSAREEKEVLDFIRDMRKDGIKVPFLIASVGMTETDKPESVWELGGEVLRKPFAQEKLLHEVERLINLPY